MDSVDTHRDEKADKPKTFAERANELFEKLSNDGLVSSDSAGLVAVLADMDENVTEEQIQHASAAVLPSTSIMFTKEEFVQFLRVLHPELSSADAKCESADGDATLPPVHGSAHVNPELGPTQMWGTETMPGARITPTFPPTLPTNEVGTKANGEWTFRPRLDAQELAFERRAFAEHLYVQVTEDMEFEIKK